MVAIDEFGVQPLEKATEIERLAQRLDLATSAARIAIWEWDLGTDALYWSPVLFDILDLDPKDFREHVAEFFDRVAPHDRKRVDSALEAHLNHNAPYDIEFEMFGSKGRPVAIAAKGQVTRDAYGKAERMVGTVQDVSDRRAIEYKLLRAERIGRIGHWDVDVTTNTLTWSPETFRIHGLDPNSPQPSVQEAFEFYHPDDVAMVAKNFEEVSETGQLRAVHARLRLKNGEIRHVYADGVATVSEDGHPLHLFGILQDRTDFVKKEEQLYQAQRLEAVGQLAGDIAHDFNNLLAVIYGNLELLLDDETTRVMSNEERADTITSALAAARGGAELTRKILTFASRSLLEPKQIMVNDLIEETESWLGRIIPSTIRCTTRLNAAPHAAKLDPAGFQSALVNVIVNARDAMPVGGELTIETETRHYESIDLGEIGAEVPPGDYIVLTVTDTGVGIEPDLLKRVFEPFVTTKGPSIGTGLGLSIVKGFMAQSGGFARIHSEVGVGTQVQMVFPVAPADDEEASSGPADDVLAQMPSTKARILLAEDKVEVLSVIARVLTAAGYGVEAATSGDNAFKLFEEKGPFDLLVTDVVMPGELSGPLLAKACRHAVPDLPVIFLTGYTDETVFHGNGLRPEDKRLVKPVPRSELLDAIVQALSPSA